MERIERLFLDLDFTGHRACKRQRLRALGASNTGYCPLHRVFSHPIRSVRREQCTDMHYFDALISAELEQPLDVRGKIRKVPNLIIIPEITLHIYKE